MTMQQNAICKQLQLCIKCIRMFIYVDLSTAHLFFFEGIAHLQF